MVTRQVLINPSLPPVKLIEKQIVEPAFSLLSVPGMIIQTAPGGLRVFAAYRHSETVEDLAKQYRLSRRDEITITPPQDGRHCTLRVGFEGPEKYIAANSILVGNGFYRL